MSTLYRKYRPQNFDDVVGQEHIIQTLKNEIATEKQAQGFLFSGPRGIGKTTTARLLAKALNCENRKKGEPQPCGKCKACEEIALGKNIDVIEIDAASHTGVDNVRENIIENAQFKPTKSKYKVFIIDEVHMLSTSAFNALLKILEEPPTHVVFILATTELHKIPATIVSRCQRFNFGKIPYEQMFKRLEKIADLEKVKIDKHVYSRIINKSDGCLRDAESLLGQILSLGDKKISEEDVSIVLPNSNEDQILNFIKNLNQKNTAENIELIDQLVNDGVNLSQFMIDLLEMMRAVLIAQNGQLEKYHFDYSKEAEKEIKSIAKEIESQKLLNLIDRTLVRKQEIKYSPIPQLPLEMLAVEQIADSRRQKTEDKSQTTDKNDDNNDTTFGSGSAPPADKKEKKEESRVRTSVRTAVSKITKKYNIKTSLKEVEEKWHEIKQKFSEKFHAVGIVLEMASLKEINSRGLRISVPFSLHKDKLDDKQVKNHFENILQECFGEKIPVLCEVEAEQPTDNINELAAEFGGEILT